MRLFFNAVTPNTLLKSTSLGLSNDCRWSAHIHLITGEEHEAISIRSLVDTFSCFWNKGSGASSMQAADN
jgi:hypothetical protein